MLEVPKTLSGSTLTIVGDLFISLPLFLPTDAAKRHAVSCSVEDGFFLAAYKTEYSRMFSDRHPNLKI